MKEKNDLQLALEVEMLLTGMTEETAPASFLSHIKGETRRVEEEEANVGMRLKGLRAPSLD